MDPLVIWENKNAKGFCEAPCCLGESVQPWITDPGVDRSASDYRLRLSRVTFAISPDPKGTACCEPVSNSASSSQEQNKTINV